MFVNSNKMIGYISINPISKEHTFLIIFLINCLVFAFHKFLFKKNRGINNKIFWTIIALITAGIVAYFFYTPNSLSNYYNYNYNAYYNSIYIHQQGIPYSKNFISAYGHYAIFLRPIFNIIGINLYTIATVTACIGFISVLSVIHTMYILIKKPFIRLLGLGAIIFPFAGFIPFPYPQAYPHRLLFPSIIMVLGTYLIKKLSTKRKILLIIGYIVSSLAIIWNSDTGIVCLVSWASLHIFLILSQDISKKRHFFKLIIPIFLIILSFFSSWEVTNLYNIAIGGNALDLYYFLFPLLENTYMWNILHTEIPLYINYWIPTLLLFFIFLGQGIASVCIKKNSIQSQNYLGFFISVLGIGQLMYFMNRCAYFNILLCYYQALLLLLVVSENTIFAFFKKKKNILDVIKTIIFFCSTSSLITLIIILLLNIGSKISSMRGYTNMSSLNDITAYLNKTVDKDTPIVSTNTAPLGIALGWKNELGFIDLPDLFLIKDKEHVINTLVNYNKPFLIDKSYYNYFRGIPGVFYHPACEIFKKITDKYDVKELTEMNKILNKYFGTSYDQLTLLYLTPKK